MFSQATTAAPLCHLHLGRRPEGGFCRAGWITRRLHVAALAVLLLWTGSAYAHLDLERGIAASQAADFDAALNSFENALAGRELTRAELVRLLSERALVLHALDRRVELETDLRYLAALEPGKTLGNRAPPSLQALWLAVVRDAAAIVLRTETRSTSAGLQIVATFEGAPPGEPSLRITLRPPGGLWKTVQASEAEFPASRGSEVEYYAEAIGLGGVSIAQVGSASEPLRAAASVEGSLASSPEWRLSDSTQPNQHGTAPSWARKHRGWLIGAAALLVAVGVVSAVVVTQRDDSEGTRVTPLVDF